MAITSRSSAPRPLSSSWRDDLKPQNKKRRCMSVERITVDTRLHECTGDRGTRRHRPMDNQNQNQNQGDRNQQQGNQGGQQSGNQGQQGGQRPEQGAGDR